MTSGAQTGAGAPVIRRMTDDDVETVAAVSARAFYDDPLQVWALPDAATRPHVLEQLFMLQSRHLSVPLGESYTDSTLSCAAFWEPPGPLHIDAETIEALKQGARVLGDAVTRYDAAMAAMRSAKPTAPHWYLQGIGTDPPYQRSGLGSAVLQPVLVRCDRDGAPAYLECTKERNVAFYERHGFRVTGAIDVPPDGPRLWSMWREPRESARRPGVER